MKEKRELEHIKILLLELHVWLHEEQQGAPSYPLYSSSMVPYTRDLIYVLNQNNVRVRTFLLKFSSICIFPSFFLKLLLKNMMYFTC